MNRQGQSLAAALRIDVVSDVVCPWCFIGKRHLDRALEQWKTEYPERAVTVCWHPFFLNPDTPEAGEPYRPFLEKKFGGPEQLIEIWARVSESGKQAGITFAFEKIELRANTLHAHRLIHFAQERHPAHHPARVGAGKTALADTLVDALFAAQFLDGRHIGDRSVLTQIAVDCGYDRAEISRYLDSDADANEVTTAAARMHEMGIGGVPFFIFNGAIGLSGAQGADALLQAMRETPPEPLTPPR